MKIRTWLLITYFIVMILPIVAIYFLFSSVTTYYEKEQVAEYFSAYERIQAITFYLEDPQLYDGKINRDEMLQHLDEQTSVSLFNSHGLLLFSSGEKLSYTEPKNQLFQNLYEVKQELRAFTYKQPVFNGTEVVGVFEIKINRDQLIQTIVTQGWVVTSLFIFIFIFIYIAVVYLVHSRVNKRLNELMNEMSALASGEAITETAIGKDEIGELKSHFYTMREQIVATQKKLATEQREKEYMMATISHDLKTPLTSIKAYAESLDANEGLPAEQQRAYRKVIIEKSDFIKQMLDDLTVHSLLQSHDYELELVTVEGEEFFEMLVSDYEPLSEQKNLQMLARSEVTGLYEVNPQQLIRVADNLIMNAIQHTEAGKSICIYAFADDAGKPETLFPFVENAYTFQFDHYAYITVQNEGAGIAKNDLQHIFEPLYQVDEARSKKDTSGTGLGLSITKQIIEKHGGTITAFSEENIGTCFICSLPKKV